LFFLKTGFLKWAWTALLQRHRSTAVSPIFRMKSLLNNCIQLHS